MFLSAGVKLLHSLFGHANQVGIVPVRIVGMASEMGTDRFHRHLIISGKLHPTWRIHHSGSRGVVLSRVNSAANPGNRLLMTS
jgi:hypothetical protein